MKTDGLQPRWKFTTPFGNYDDQVEEGRLYFTTAWGNNIAASQKKIAFALHRARARLNEGKGQSQRFMHSSQRNKWRGATISLRTDGQGRPTPIHIPTPSLPYTHSNIRKKYLNRSFFYFSTRPLPKDRRTDQRTNGRTDGPTDGRTDGWIKPLIKLRVRN